MGKTKRKPSPSMVFDALKKLGLGLEDFEKIVVFGDREEDEKLASNLHAIFFNIKNKTEKEIIEFALNL
jgi:histidinol phosphatase-like enzyme